MCGRYALKATAGEMIEHFKLLSCLDFAERYNIAPRSIIPVIRSGSHVLICRPGGCLEVKEPNRYLSASLSVMRI